MNFTLNKLGAAAAVLIAASAVGGFSVASTADSGHSYPITPTGQTYGTLPGTGDLLDLSSVPDLVKVVGDNGREGYADARAVLGLTDVVPVSPAQALAQQKLNVTTSVPVYAANGTTVIDTFTIAGSDAGGVEVTTVP